MTRGPMSLEQRKKISEAMRNRRLSDEHRQKISESRKNCHVDDVYDLLCKLNKVKLTSIKKLGIPEPCTVKELKVVLHNAVTGHRSKKMLSFDEDRLNYLYGKYTETQFQHGYKLVLRKDGAINGWNDKYEPRSLRNFNEWQELLSILGQVAKIAAMYNDRHFPEFSEFNSVQFYIGIMLEKSWRKYDTSRPALGWLLKSCYNCRGYSPVRVKQDLQLKEDFRKNIYGKVGVSVKSDNLND